MISQSLDPSVNSLVSPDAAWIGVDTLETECLSRPSIDAVYWGRVLEYGRCIWSKTCFWRRLALVCHRSILSYNISCDKWPRLPRSIRHWWYFLFCRGCTIATAYTAQTWIDWLIDLLLYDTSAHKGCKCQEMLLYIWKASNMEPSARERNNVNNVAYFVTIILWKIHRLRE